MFFKEEFIDSLKADPVAGTIQMVDLVGEVTSASPDWDDNQYDVLVEAYALVIEMLYANILPLASVRTPPSLSSGGTADCGLIWGYLVDIQKACQIEMSNLKVSSLRSRFRTKLGSCFVYEFSQGDLDRVQHLINELRDQISKTKVLEQEHQQRLLHRLEKLQAEMHKKVSDLDRYWGLVGDAGVILAKLGNDAKPLVDRIREIVDIVWRTQSRAEELPSGTRLPSLEDNRHEIAEEV
ncbi:hypothetical protein [Nitrosospira sp. NRS527]|uniref:hypothetical protein n=1 Tax=Nitrosospira sp. NRS527 TaxID=155925 RepID=UPI001AF0A4EF|nr:hypothetical protein [Nitrosospira sp. NRS527]BCT69256.1 hypothetical protein NNRS527_02871 [Nitrosospira sp. NRS527]